MMPNSLKYIALLSVTAVCHALMPKRGRNALLLAASWLFYLLSMPKYLPLLIVVTGATFLTAKWMENHPDRKRCQRRYNPYYRFGCARFTQPEILFIESF